MTNLRFVLLRHEMPREAARPSHWDLMLEYDGKLLTWELPSLEMPSLPADFQTLGIRPLPDHRLHYLDYEGKVSGGRGSVTQEDRGTYSVSDATQNGMRVVHINGSRFTIELELPRACFSSSLVEAGRELVQQSCQCRVQRFGWK